MKLRRPIFSLLFAFALVAAGGCGTPYGWNKTTEREVDAALGDARKANQRAAVPSEVKEALLAPLQMPLPDQEAAQLEPRFDLTVTNAPARQMFLGLVEGTRYSMIVHPDVAGNISLNLKDVTVPEAMDAIRRLYGYEYKRDQQRFMVLPRGMQTRLFPVNYLNLNRHGRSQTRVVSGELTNAPAGSGTASGAAGGAPYGAAGGRGNAGIQVETESKADFWKELETTVKALVGSEGGRAVVANPQSGLLVVRAMPDELRVVEDFLGITQSTVNRQVVLEAKILEVELKDRFQTGINWADVGRVGSADVTTGQVGGGSVFGGTGVSEIAGATGNLNPANYSGIIGTATSAFGGVFSLAIRHNSFAAFIELLKTQGTVHVLSSPRVSTVNNQKALIKVGGDEFFVTGLRSGSTTAVGGNVTNTAPEIELTPFFSGIALDVTPQIDDNQNIVLHIHPAVSEVTQRTKNLRVAGDDYSLPLALSSIQESDNIVRAASGQVIVIGGLMKEGATDENASVPFLGDIPMVGNLFKHKRITRIKKELVILLRPTVVESAQIWGDMVDQSQGRIEQIRRER